MYIHSGVSEHPGKYISEDVYHINKTMNKYVIRLQSSSTASIMYTKTHNLPITKPNPLIEAVGS